MAVWNIIPPPVSAVDIPSIPIDAGRRAVLTCERFEPKAPWVGVNSHVSMRRKHMFSI